MSKKDRKKISQINEIARNPEPLVADPGQPPEQEFIEAGADFIGLRPGPWKRFFAWQG